VPIDLSELNDRVEITELLYESFRRLDHADVAGVAALFTEDAVFDFAPGGSAAGRDVIEGVMGQLLVPYVHTSHHISNVQIRFESPDRALVISYVMGWHEYADETPNATAYGEYNDTWERTTGGWKVAARKILAHGLDGFVYDPYWIPRAPTSAHG